MLSFVANMFVKLDRQSEECINHNSIIGARVNFPLTMADADVCKGDESIFESEGMIMYRTFLSVFSFLQFFYEYL